MKKRECIVCGKEYEPKAKNQKYCSQKCAMWKNIDADYFGVLYRDNFRCRYCGRTPDDGIKLTVDHVYPKSEDGGEDSVNIVTACKRCNSRKGKTLWKEDKIKEIWWRSKKLSQKKPKKDYREMIEEFREEYPERPIPDPKPV